MKNQDKCLAENRTATSKQQSGPKFPILARVQQHAVYQAITKITILYFAIQPKLGCNSGRIRMQFRLDCMTTQAELHPKQGSVAGRQNLREGAEDHRHVAIQAELQIHTPHPTLSARFPHATRRSSPFQNALLRRWCFS